MILNKILSYLLLQSPQAIIEQETFYYGEDLYQSNN